jgi:hypothetical protein
MEMRQDFFVKFDSASAPEKPKNPTIAIASHRGNSVVASRAITTTDTHPQRTA